MRILILGGDGFCGWPTSLHLSASGHEVAIVDNLARRNADVELEAASLTPIEPLGTRLAAWRELTGREIEVLQLISEGKTNKEIARILSLSINTVESHRKHVMEKLGARSLSTAVRMALAAGVEMQGRLGLASVRPLISGFQQLVASDAMALAVRHAEQL